MTDLSALLESQHARVPGPSSERAHRIRSVALLESLGDLGIGGYTHELAEGLASIGISADVFTVANPATLSLPRRHRVYPVLGSSLFSQRELLRGPGSRAAAPDGTRRRSGAPRAIKLVSRRAPRLRTIGHMVELAAFLRVRRYDLVWIQWPVTEYGWLLRRLLRVAGTPVVHTVHNVLPHEPQAGDVDRFRRLYALSDALIVHSEAARRDLIKLYPATEPKAVVVPFGAHSQFPAPAPGVRSRLRTRLDIGRKQFAVLCFGPVRPYKNLDAVLEALTLPGNEDLVVIVAGREHGYPDADPDDPLRRTRRLVERLGVGDRVRLLGGTFSRPEAGELFAAADAVALPYVKSYGSGLLIQAMTLGKHVLMSRTGGMDEYVTRFAHYPWHTLLDGTDAAAIARGLRHAADAVRRNPPPLHPPLPALAWSSVAHRSLGAIERLLTPSPRL